MDNGPEEIPTEGHARLGNPRLGKHAFKYSLENVSTLILGGYDENSFVDTLNYYDTSATDSWNITADYMMLDKINAMATPPTDDTPITPMTVEFQTGYPYIGLSTASWDILVNLVN